MPEPPRLIEGRVLDPAGAPVAMASVYFAGGPVMLPDVAALTGPDGAFRLSAPVDGAYSIGVAAGGYAPKSVTIEVGPGRPSVGLEVVLRPG